MENPALNLALQKPQIAYYRVSTVKQGQSGLGLDGQKAMVKNFLGKDPDFEFIEIETGTSKNRRPILKIALEKVKDVGGRLVIAKLDRLSRNVHFTSGLMESGVNFVCCDNPSATPMVLYILASVAEDEARSIADRTRRGLAVKKERIKKSGGFVNKRGIFCTRLGNPGDYVKGIEGYNSVRMGLETVDECRKRILETKKTNRLENPDRIRAKSLIGDMYSNGNSVKAIRQMLDRAGIKTIYGYKYCDSQIRRILEEVKMEKEAQPC